MRYSDFSRIERDAHAEVAPRVALRSRSWRPWSRSSAASRRTSSTSRSRSASRRPSSTARVGRGDAEVARGPGPQARLASATLTGAPTSAGLSCATQRLARLLGRGPVFEALSCGRDHLRCVAAGLSLPEAAGGRAGRTAPGAAGSLVLGRMDRRCLVRARKHGTKSGTGAPLRWASSK